MSTNYKTTLLLFALIITIGISLLGTHIKSGILGFKDSERVVYVKGSSEIDVDADKVIWPILYKLAGNDLNLLYKNHEKTEKVIRDFLTGYGLTDEEISVGTPTVEDLYTDRYRSQEVPTYRYHIGASVTVNSKKVHNVLKAMQNSTTLMQQGVVISSAEWGRDAVQFTFNGLNDVKPELVKKATANARISAEKFASDSGSKLGKIKTARQGEVSIFTPDATSPHKKRVRVVTAVEYYLKD